MKHLALQTVSSFSRYSGLNFMARPALGGAGAILMFHRFTDMPDERLNVGGTVSVEFFDQLLGYLAEKNIHVVALKDVPEALEEGRRFVCLTIDDGYRDNKELALPILEKYKVPATIFIPSGVLDRSLNAWWLQIESISKTPQEYAKFSQQCMRRAETLDELRALFSFDQKELNEKHFLSPSEIKNLATHDLIDIGGHTRTHPNLKSLSDEEALAEIQGNKNDLEDLLGQEIEVFAYPFGNSLACGVREFEFAKQAGYKVAVTTVEKNIMSKNNPFALPRFGIRGHLEDLKIFDMIWSGTYQFLKA